MESDSWVTKGFLPNLIHVFLNAAFFFGFCMLYNPFNVITEYSFGHFSYGTHLLLISCIILVSLALSRVIFWLFQKIFTITWWQYIIWCVWELFFTSCFIAMYTVLFRWGELMYFPTLWNCMRLTFMILMYPYTFLIMWHIIQVMENSSDMEGHEPESALMKFLDEHHKLKFTIDQTAILFISAEFNYIKVCYQELDKVRSFLLRNSMKSQEENAIRHGLVRCHRSYYINPKHIKLLKKEKDGRIFAVMDAAEAPQVPISKQYYETLTDIL